jgi:hypothetical protein
MESFINDFISASVSRGLFVLLTLILAGIVFILADLFFIRRNVEKFITPMWPIILLSYWTLSHRVKNKLDKKLKTFFNGFTDSTNTQWDKERREEFLKYLISNSEQEIVKSSLRSIIIELKKLDSDILLLDQIIGDLNKKSKLIWPGFLLLIVPFVKQYPSITRLHMQVTTFKFSVERHNKLLLPYLEKYVSGDKDVETCKLIANYLPYFAGSNFRLTEGVSKQFTDDYVKFIDQYNIPIVKHIYYIDLELKNTKSEVNRSSLFSWFKNDKDKLTWLNDTHIWNNLDEN